jgi:phosphatidylserine decarboxylase
LATDIFARAFKINLSEAEVPQGGFKCIAELFNRSLVPGARVFPQEERALVSPVDGKLRSARLVREGLEQVKGQHYSLSKLLGNDPLADRFQEGWAFNFYLSPPDYHHIHAPLSGRVVKSRYIPGRLWPVNDWALHNVADLFCENERLITFVETDRGLLAVVMVGAFNVGRISTEYDDWLTNSGQMPKELVREYAAPKFIERGVRLGSFHMGSSVVLLTEWNEEEKTSDPQDEKRAMPRSLGPVRFGEALFE